MRWYEAVTEALSIWLYYLGIRVYSGTRRGRAHKYHEHVLESLGRPDNPFYEIFSGRGLVPYLRQDRRFQYQYRWRYENLPVTNPFGNWELLASYLRVVNDALEDALETFSDELVGI